MILPHQVKHSALTNFIELFFKHVVNNLCWDLIYVLLIQGTLDVSFTKGHQLSFNICINIRIVWLAKTSIEKFIEV